MYSVRYLTACHIADSFPQKYSYQIVTMGLFAALKLSKELITFFFPSSLNDCSVRCVTPYSLLKQ